MTGETSWGPVTGRLPDDPQLHTFSDEADAMVAAGTATDAVSARETVAGRYGFTSWDALADRVWLVDRLTRWPTPAEPSEDPAAGINDPERLANRFCRLGCLTWTADDATGPASARRLLERHPWLAGVNAYTLALTGRAEELSALLAADPEAARRPGGPHDWPPLLYLCYGRLAVPTGPAGPASGDPTSDPGGGPGGELGGDLEGEGPATRTLRVLLEAGADPDTGFLWHGRLSPFTALTGIFGGGPAQPPHPEAESLADLLLRHGADPNDHQTLLHRMPAEDDTHLRVLLGFGLGREQPSRWRERLGDHYPAPAAMVVEQLRYAAAHGRTERVRMLLEHDVPAEETTATGRSPVDGTDRDGASRDGSVTDRLGARLTAYRLAVLAGHTEAAALLAGAGADTARADAVDELAGRLGAGDAWSATLSVEADPDLVGRARERFPQAVSLAAEFGRLGGVLLLLAHGWDPAVAQPDGRAALHFAARAGHLAMVQALLDHGARADVRDDRGAVPADWARGAGHTDLAAQLETLA